MRARSQRRSLGARSLAQATLEKNTAAFDPQPLDVGVSDHAAGRSRSLARATCSPPTVSTSCALRILRTRHPVGGKRSEAAKRAGLKTILNIIYSISPKHTDEYFIERTRAAAKARRRAYLFKDPGGLLTPESTRRLVPLIRREAKGQTGRISYPLQHRTRRAVLSRSDPARHHLDQHGDSAARRWLVQPVDLQRRHERTGAWLPDPRRRRIAQAGARLFHRYCQTRKSAGGQAARIRRLSPAASSAGRHDFQLPFSAWQSGQARPVAARCWKKFRASVPSSVIRSW